MGGELVGLPDIRYGAALGRGGRWTVTIALRLADRVTVGSEFGRELALGRAPAARLRVMPLGIDRAVFKPSGAEPAGANGPGQPTILFVGSLEPVKDPGMLVRAFVALAADRPGLGLAIAGDGSLRAALDDLIGRLGVQDRVRFLGRLPRAGMPRVYRSASVLAVPSRHEGQSMVAVEAVACGLPVVGTRVGILPELGAAATTVPIGDEPALTAALASLLDDPALVSRMSGLARGAAARFDLDRTTEAFLAAYDELVAARAT
jgi:glycosyltransferase involved in cell wall biosynthesis